MAAKQKLSLATKIFIVVVIVLAAAIIIGGVPQAAQFFAAGPTPVKPAPVPVKPIQIGLCGDGVCSSGETSTNCPEDCRPAAVCGNGNTEPGEECDPPGSFHLNCRSDEICTANCQCELPPQCTRRAPTISLAPMLQSGRAGEARSYSLTITNTDTDACGISTFDIFFPECPFGRLMCTDPADITMGPGSRTITLTVRAWDNVQPGTYTFTVQTFNKAGQQLQSNTVRGSFTVT